MKTPTSSHPFALLFACATALGLMLAPSLAHAQDDGSTASCSFLEIQASNDGKGIDSKLKALEKKFVRPPLSAWSKFTLLARHDKKLQLSKSDVLTTASKNKLEVVYEEYTRGKKERFKLRLTFKKPNGKVLTTTSVTMDSGDYLIIGGAARKGPSEFLAITCKK